MNSEKKIGRMVRKQIGKIGKPDRKETGTLVQSEEQEVGKLVRPGKMKTRSWYWYVK